MSLRVFTRINGNAVSYMRLRVCSRAGLIETQNAFARKQIAKLKHTFLSMALTIAPAMAKLASVYGY